MNKKEQELILIATIIAHNLSDSIFNWRGTINMWDIVKDATEAFFNKYKKQILDKSTDWAEVSEKAGYSDYEEMTVDFATKYIEKKYNISVSCERL